MIKAPPHTLLPPDAIAALQKAAQVQPTKEDPLARRKAIEQVTARIKYHYPHLFRKEQENESETL